MKQNNSPVLIEMFLQVKKRQNKYLFIFILLLLLFLSLLLLRRQRKATMGRSRRRGRPHAKSSSCKEGDPSRRRRDSVTSFYGRSLCCVEGDQWPDEGWVTSFVNIPKKKKRGENRVTSFMDGPCDSWALSRFVRDGCCCCCCCCCC